MLQKSNSPRDTASAALEECLCPLSTHSIRRDNLRQLLTAFAQERVSAGQATKGIEQAFAAHLQISPSMLSQIKRSRNISDSLAKQIERLSAKTDGWLSQSHAPNEDLPSNAVFNEDSLVDLVRKKWRFANIEQRRRMVLIIQELGH